MCPNDLNWAAKLTARDGFSGMGVARSGAFSGMGVIKGSGR